MTEEQRSRLAAALRYADSPKSSVSALEHIKALGDIIHDLEKQVDELESKVRHLL